MTRARKANNAWAGRGPDPNGVADATGAIGKREPCSCEFDGDCVHVDGNVSLERTSIVACPASEHENGAVAVAQLSEGAPRDGRGGAGTLSSLDTIVVVDDGSGGVLSAAPQADRTALDDFPAYHSNRCRALREADAGVSGGERLPYYTMEQVSRHCTPADCWMAAAGKVYDATDFMQLHPGGPRSLMLRAGGNATTDMKFHPTKSMRYWKAVEIGRVCQCVPKGGKHPAGGGSCGICVVQ
jgi:hypothetical protein